MPTLVDAMKWTWKLGRIAGVDAHVHASFLLLVAWAAWSAYAGSGTFLAVFMGIAFLIAVFASVLLHELGHALMARRYGIHTRQILLLPIGGVAQLEGEPRTPRQELAIALAGPAVNFAIAANLALLIAVGILPATGFLASILVTNVSIGLFNLIPAFPMDGGRVLRAALAERIGGRRATEIAVKVAKITSVTLGLVGLFTNWLLTAIAVFVWMAAESESRQRSGGHRTTDPRIVSMFDPRERVIVFFRR